MKIQKEEIQFEPDRSFKIFHPRLRHYFFWHYHKEIELVYVEAISGIRHVGKSVSGFMGGDLILIGGDVPHLNFDYGIETEYKQIVLQLRDNFVDDIIGQTPEFSKIATLLGNAYRGLTYQGETKTKVVGLLKQMLKPDNKFSDLLLLLEILQTLANSEEYQELNSEDTRVSWFYNDKIRMGTIYGYIHAHYNKQASLDDLAEIVHLSKAAFCRYFKKQTNMTFTQFLNQYRINMAKSFLLQDTPVTEVCYQVGYDSPSYFNKMFKKIVGQTPTNFRTKFAMQHQGR